MKYACWMHREIPKSELQNENALLQRGAKMAAFLWIHRESKITWFAQKYWIIKAIKYRWGEEIYE